MSDYENERELLDTWMGGLSRTVWRTALERATTPEGAAVSRGQLERTPQPLDALSANTALIRALIGPRWIVIRDAIDLAFIVMPVIGSALAT